MPARLQGVISLCVAVVAGSGGKISHKLKSIPDMKKIESPEEKAKRELIEGIASNIESLAKSVSALMNGPLKRKALLVLLASSTQMTQTQVGNVLTALENLKSDWLK